MFDAHEIHFEAALANNFPSLDFSYTVNQE